MREIKLRVWDKIKHRMFIPGNDQHNSLFAFEGGRVIYYNLQKVMGAEQMADIPSCNPQG